MNIIGARVHIQDLRVVYEGGITAVDRLNLEIQPGEFVTLLGPSGSGKTSALMAIAGFAAADAGRALLDDQDILAQPPNQRNLGLVFQDYALFPHMSVAQNIGFPLRMREWPQREIDAAVEEALRMVRLESYAGRRPTSLSGGEQQRVALARATVFQPPFLLMDEPLGALDKQLREQLQQELKRIQRDTGITTLYVTHDQDEAMMLSDRVAVLREGRVEQVGTPAELYETPHNRFVAGFIGETNFIAGRVVLRGGEPVLDAGDGWELPLRTDGGHPDGTSVETALRPERIMIDPADTDVLVSAEVVDVVYGGEMIRLRVRLSSGRVLAVKQQNRGRVPRLAPGDDVLLGWNSDDLLVIPRSPSVAYDV